MARHYVVSARMASASANLPRGRCNFTEHSVVTLSTDLEIRHENRNFGSRDSVVEILDYRPSI